jgi:NADPH2:quinone reductase
MVAAVRVHKNGGPEVLTYEDVEVPAPGPGQVRVKNHACGLNYIDTYFRSGLYQAPGGLPFVAGNEAAGEIVAVGPGVTDAKVGDRVAYTSALGATRPSASYSADRVVKLPDQISRAGRGHDAQGHDGQYLLHRTFWRRRDERPDQAAAGGSVSSPANGRTTSAPTIGKSSARRRRRSPGNGCHHHPLSRGEDFPPRSRRSPAATEVVYDGVGKATFPASHDCIKPPFAAGNAWPDREATSTSQAVAILHTPTLNTYAAGAKTFCRSPRTCSTSPAR